LKTARILLVEDERIVGANLQQRLRQLGYEVPQVAVSGEEALRAAGETAPDLVLMDIRIEGEMDGIETARLMNLSDALPIPVIYLTAHSEESTIERARATRPYGYLLKPFSERELHATIQMALERKLVETRLHDSEQCLRLAFDVAAIGALDVNVQTARVSLTGGAQDMLGLAGTAPTTVEDLLAHVHASDRQEVSAGMALAMLQRDGYRSEFRVLADGVRRWLRLEMRLLDGTRMIGVVQDISAHKQAEVIANRFNAELEHQVVERTGELNSRVAEIDAFSYSVAHDLRGPVRAITAFSQILLEEHAHQLDDKGRHYLERMRLSGLRMAELIDALLVLAKLGRDSLRFAPVDLSAMALGIMAQLREEQPARSAEFALTEGLLVQADPGMMHLVLDNLLRNAWKFTSKREFAHIAFGANQVGGETVYFVSDDGAGFDMAFSKHLFGIFRRLHSDNEFPGAGIGLATVQRIVHRHGGRIWAEGAVGKGATIYFVIGAP